MSECLWQLRTDLTPDEQLWLDEQRARRQEIAHVFDVPAYLLDVPAGYTTACDVHEARCTVIKALIRAFTIAVRNEVSEHE